MKTLSALILLITGLAWGISPAIAEDTPASTKKTAKKSTSKKASATKKETHAEADKEPEVKDLQSMVFNCEFGNKLTIYRDANDDQQIALHWNKRTHRMTRVSTATGANRFENAKSGLVWIGIPAKGMLLDSKKGKQLANECKSADQAE